MFLFSFFLMLFCVVWYSVGIHLYLGCRDLKDGQLIDNFMGDRIKIGDHVVSINTVLNECRDNQALFKSIGGESAFNLTKQFDFRNVSILFLNSKIDSPKTIHFVLNELCNTRSTTDIKVHLQRIMGFL